MSIKHFFTVVLRKASFNNVPKTFAVDTFTLNGENYLKLFGSEGIASPQDVPAKSALVV